MATLGAIHQLLRNCCLLPLPVGGMWFLHSVLFVVLLCFLIALIFHFSTLPPTIPFQFNPYYCLLFPSLPFYDVMSQPSSTPPPTQPNASHQSASPASLLQETVSPAPEIKESPTFKVTLQSFPLFFNTASHHPISILSVVLSTMILSLPRFPCPCRKRPR